MVIESKPVLSGPLGSPLGVPLGGPLGAEGAVGFLPTDIANLLSWHDATDEDTVISAGNQVSNWLDKSGNGNDLVQSTGANQPRTNIITIGGKNAIDFDGTDDSLVKTSFAVNNNLTFFIVAQVEATNNASDSILSLNASNNDFQIDAVVTNEFRGRFQSSGLGSSTPPADANFVGEDFILTYRLSGNDSNVKMRRNGVAIAQDSYNGLLVSNQTLMLATNRNNNQFAPSRIGEVIFYNRDLLQSEIDLVEAAMINKWGI